MISRHCRVYGVENNVRSLQPYQLSIPSCNVIFHTIGEFKHMFIAGLFWINLLQHKRKACIQKLQFLILNWAKNVANSYLSSQLLLWASHRLTRYRKFLLTFITDLKLRMMNLKKLRSKKIRALTVPHLVARLRKGLMMHGWDLTLEEIEIPLFYTKNTETT